MIECIAIDDEPLALELIRAYCETIDSIHLQGTFTKTSDALKHLRSNTVDLLFLDINMPDISGIEFYKSLDEKLMVIFTTAHSEYAVEGFELNAIDYLLKPYSPERFEKAVNKAREFHEFNRKESNDTNFIFVRADYRLVKIDCNEILFLESTDDYVKIHLLGKKPVMTLGTLKVFEEKLPKNNFIRVHRSYIAALNKIESVRGRSIQLANTEIPVSGKYEADFFSTYTKDWS
ncbi:MAG: response regulator transcription factor [Sphingobacteriales bacterium]|nr:response regulator transcription factor [Sphingobacteriales bacterium]